MIAATVDSLFILWRAQKVVKNYFACFRWKGVNRLFLQTTFLPSFLVYNDFLIIIYTMTITKEVLKTYDACFRWKGAYRLFLQTTFLMSFFVLLLLYSFPRSYWYEHWEKITNLVWCDALFNRLLCFWNVWWYHILKEGESIYLLFNTWCKCCQKGLYKTKSYLYSCHKLLCVFASRNTKLCDTIFNCSIFWSTL